MPNEIKALYWLGGRCIDGLVGCRESNRQTQTKGTGVVSGSGTAFAFCLYQSGCNRGLKVMERSNETAANHAAFLLAVGLASSGATDAWKNKIGLIPQQVLVSDGNRVYQRFF